MVHTSPGMALLKQVAELMSVVILMSPSLSMRCSRWTSLYLHTKIDVGATGN